MNSTRTPRFALVLAGLVTTATVTQRADAALPQVAPPTAAMLPPAASPYAMVGTEELLEEYGAVQKIFIDMMIELSKQLPSGTKNPRENMYAGLAAIWMAGAVGGAFNVGAGTALGATIAALPSVGAGAPVGAAVGFFGGLAITQAELIVLGVGTMAAVEHIEKTFPAEKFGARGGAATAGMLAAQGSSAHAGAWDGTYMFTAAAHAGPYESLFVHLVTASFNPEMEKAMRGIANPKSAGTVAFLRPAAERLLYIHDHQRIAAGAKPAEPLAGWMKTASLVLRADEATLEALWLRALGLGSMSVSVSGGKLVLVPPKALRDLGAPERISQTLGALALRIDAPAPINASLRASLSPGPFDIELGDPQIVKSGSDKGKVKISLKVKKGAVLASGSLEVRINTDVHRIGGDVSPKLDRALVASAYFRFQGGVLAFDRVEVGELSLKAGLPELPAPLAAAVGGLVAQAEREVEKAVRGMFGGKAVEEAFASATKKSMRALAKELEGSARTRGMASVSDITKIEITDGKMAVTVTGNRVTAPSTASTAQVKAAFGAVAKTARRVIAPIERVGVGK